jgi:16S rRNA (guanine527-N7)-methyltransferase
MQREWLATAAKELGIDLSDRQLDQFAIYYDLLIETNKKMNLTAITDPLEVYIKHFYDSLTVAKACSLNHVATLIDVGTGAGFPGIPLKIAFPHLRLVLVDSLQKRVRFLDEVAARCGLAEVTCIHGRAEELGQNPSYRESFDLVTARAVARLSVLAELCLPFARVGGMFIAMKGPSVEEELSEAQKALDLLGKAKVQNTSLALPENQGERNLLAIQKQKPTPKKYPRRPGIPQKEPIK